MRKHLAEVREKLTEADSLARQANGGQMVSGNGVESYRNSLADAYERIADLEQTWGNENLWDKPYCPRCEAPVKSVGMEEGPDGSSRTQLVYTPDKENQFHPNTQWPSW